MSSAVPPLPALLGGPVVRPEGPPSWPFPDEEILAALETAYREGSWGKYQGGNVERLERALAEYHGVEFAMTCGSGTFAVEVALRALRVGPADEVVLAAYDYGGNFLGVHAVGALPVLVDVRQDNWQLDVEKVAEAVGPKTRVILASHLHGGVVPMKELARLASERGLRVIEDAAQSPGAVVQGRKAGTWGDVGILSFGGSKLLTAGRGGALLTRHADVFQRARVVLNRANLICPLSELQAAVLLPQLTKLDVRNAHREGNVRNLVERLRASPGLHPFVNRASDTSPGYYKLGFRYDAGQLGGLPRERFLAAARAEGIAMDEGFRGLHVGRSASRFRRAGDLNEATKADEGAVVLHHPVLSGGELEIEQVGDAVAKLSAHCELLCHRA